jgi:hypothetical protein
MAPAPWLALAAIPFLSFPLDPSKQRPRLLPAAVLLLVFYSLYSHRPSPSSCFVSCYARNHLALTGSAINAKQKGRALMLTNHIEKPPYFNGINYKYWEKMYVYLKTKRGILKLFIILGIKYTTSKPEKKKYNILGKIAIA